jgi:hypothetical protein
MTEEDWANQVEPLAKTMFWESPYNYYEYRLAVNAWADWCEEGNGGPYHAPSLLTAMKDAARAFQKARKKTAA